MATARIIIDYCAGKHNARGKWALHHLLGICMMRCIFDHLGPTFGHFGELPV